MVDAAGKGEALPAFKSSRNEAFDYVSLAVLKTFVEHDYYKIRLSERELRQRALELTALQAQMNPHFLFNTLTTIAFKAMQLTGGRNEVSDMVKELSEMLAYSLSDAGARSTIGAELAHTRSYVEIQRRRFGDGLRCEWAVAPNLEALPCVKLLLQPLVENAFEHGFAGRRGGLVRVTGRREDGGTVELVVEDDGAGIEPGRLEELRGLMGAETASPGHVGLVNTVRRLKLAYGEAATCEVESESGSGTCVTLRFPAAMPDAGLSSANPRA